MRLFRVRPGAWFILLSLPLPCRVTCSSLKSEEAIVDRWTEIVLSRRSRGIRTVFSFTVKGLYGPTFFGCSLSYTLAADFWQWIGTVSACTGKLAHLHENLGRTEQGGHGDPLTTFKQNEYSCRSEYEKWYPVISAPVRRIAGYYIFF